MRAGNATVVRNLRETFVNARGKTTGALTTVVGLASVELRGVAAVLLHHAPVTAPLALAGALLAAETAAQTQASESVG